MSTENTPREGLALPQIVAAGLVFALITVVIILLLEIGFYAMRDAEVARKSVTSEEAAMLEAAQAAKLQEPVRWVDAEAGRVGMPIEKAMAAVVRRANADGEAATP